MDHTRQSYEVSIFVDVYNEEALLIAAKERAIKDGMDPDTVEEMDVEDALRWLLDPGISPPGTSLEDSSVTRLGGVG